MKKILVFYFLISSLSLLSRPIISTYIRTWPLGLTDAERKKGNYWSNHDIDGSLIDDLIVAFARINRDGSIFILDVDASAHNTAGFSNFSREIRKLKRDYPNMKIGLAIGGWGADGFSQVATNKNLRKKFLDNVLKKIRKYDFDSIDINWLYPVNGGGSIKSSSRDKENFTLLLKELNKKIKMLEIELNKDISITIATGAMKDYINWVEMDKIVPYVDSVKILSYDFYGSWTPTTGHISNLYKSKYGVDDTSVDMIVNYFIENNLPREKLIISVPLYGRVWKGVNSKNNGLYQPFKKILYHDGISFDKVEGLIDMGFQRYWDEKAMVPYLKNDDILVSYEDSESIRAKAEYVKKMGLKGIAFWEYGHNLNGKLINIAKREFEK